MVDVRLTATNPDDSSVVPVSCTAAGLLRVEPQVQGPPGQDGQDGRDGRDGLDAPQWEMGTWIPSYESSEVENFAVIEYSTRAGIWHKLGDMVWWTCALATSAVTITNPRGLLALTGLPYVFTGGPNEGVVGNCVIQYGRDFREHIPVGAFHRSDGTLNFSQYQEETGDRDEFMPVIGLREGSEMIGVNQLQLTGWFSSSGPAEYKEPKPWKRESP